MISEFVAQFARLIASFPDDVRVDVTEGDEVTEILLFANQADIGKLIGKEGKTARAIRTLVHAAASKERKRAVLEILE